MQVKGYKFSSTQAYYDFINYKGGLVFGSTKKRIDEAIVSWVLMFGLDGVMQPLNTHAPDELLKPLWRYWIVGEWQLVHRPSPYKSEFALSRIGKSYYKQLCKDINKVNKI